MTTDLTTKTVFELAQSIVRKTRAALPVGHEVRTVIQTLVERGIRLGMDRERDNVGATLHHWEASYTAQAAAARESGNLDKAQHMKSKADAIGQLLASITPARPGKVSAASSPKRNDSVAASQ